LIQVIEEVRDIEQRRGQTEQQLYREACSELKALTNILLRDMAEGLRHRSQSPTVPKASFLEMRSRLPDQVNVRVSSSTHGFPRVLDLVQAMEKRRDVAESRGRQRVLELELKLLQAERAMVAEALDQRIA